MAGFGIGFAIIIIGAWMAPNADTRMDGIACITCIVVGVGMMVYGLAIS